MKQRSLALAAIAAVAILVDCGGGGGGGAAVAPSTTTGGGTATTISAPAGTLKATMKITVPAGSATSSGSRRIKMVPSNTQSIVFTLNQTSGTGLAPGSVQGPFGLTASSPGCTSSSAGVTCSLSINAPIGSNIFTADIYSSTNAAAGTQLGSGAVEFSVAQNAANTASISLNGPIAQIILASNCPATNVINYFNFLNACVLGDVGYFDSQLLSSARKPAVLSTAVPLLNTVRVFVIALDSSGTVIVNPTVYDQPVTLELVGQPLLSLTATYAGISLPFTNNAASASTSTNGGTVQLWSPLDVATLSIVPNTTGLVEGYLFSGIGTAVPVPVSSSSPTPNPNVTPGPFLYIGAAINPGATPTPLPTATPTPPPPVLVWTNDQANGVAGTSYSPANGGVLFTAVTNASNPTQFTADLGAPVPLPSTAPTNYTFGLANNTAGAVTYTINDGGGSGSFSSLCGYADAGAGILYNTFPITVTSSGSANVSVPVALQFIAGSPGACSITATDGLGHTSYLNIGVESGNVTVQGRRRQ